VAFRGLRTAASPLSFKNVRSTQGNIIMSSSNGNQGATLALAGRILIAVTFILSGLGKLGAPAATQGYIAAMGLPAPLLAYIGAVLMEVGGGALLLAGYRTKLVAIALAIFCVVTALIFHRALGDQNQMINFFKNLAMAGGLLQVAAFGAGSIGLDSRLVARAAS
jgi:putative oxidoreductase